MKTIKVILNSGNHTVSDSEWTVISNGATGSQALNFTDGSSSGLSLNISNFPSGDLNQSGYSNGDKHGIPQDVIKATGVFGGTSELLSQIEGTLNSGDKVTTIKCWGASSVDDSARKTAWTIGGVTKTHDDRAFGAASPTEFTPNADTLPLTIDAKKASGASFGYPQVLIISVGPSFVVSGHTDPVQPGDTATITVNDSSLVTGVEFGPVTGISFTAPTSTTVEYTVPEAFANGLAFGFQTVTVTDGTNTDTISVTLDTPSAVDFEGTVSGFDSLDASAESSLKDTSITVVDGDYQVVRDPNNIIDTFRANGAHTYSATGSIFLRVLDVSDTTDSSQGTWTTEREVVIAAPVGIPATPLQNDAGTLDTNRAVTRTITRVSDNTQLFTGSQTSDATTAELPGIDLSATSAATGEAVDDRVVRTSPSNPGVVAVTVRRNVEDTS